MIIEGVDENGITRKVATTADGNIHPYAVDYRIKHAIDVIKETYDDVVSALIHILLFHRTMMLG